MSTLRPEEQVVEEWFSNQGWEPFDFQRKAWSAYRQGYSGIVNAPTGSGKTYSMFMALAQAFMRKHPKDYQDKDRQGLIAIWITPIRALTKEIHHSAERACRDLGLPWQIGIRTGDTTSSERQKQKRRMPEMLITTPESLHLLMASKQYAKLFKRLDAVVIDEWHELIGSKRGVQIELALSRLRVIRPRMRTWGISATIGNMDEALDVLMGYPKPKKTRIVRSKLKKKIEVVPIIPDKVESYPWSGHLGLSLADKVVPIIAESKTTLIFTNTRGQCELWYQKILDVAPELAGAIAMHHGSISKQLRHWVENELHEERLKAVVCTSSLDLGVDFRPVESIIQIGGPKGVSRFMQRAGRSGHQPGETSRIYFLPTNSLELIESAALRHAVKHNKLESRKPFIRSFDVLVQYMVTLAVSDGFRPDELLAEVRRTYSYYSISDDEWRWALNFITTGGESLHAYDEYKKVEVEDGLFVVNDRRTAMRHRLSIGTIVSDPVMKVKWLSGGTIGTIEEGFISRLKPGDVFWFAGRNLALYRINGNDVLVKRSKEKNGRTPSWQGGRMSLSSEMAEVLRVKLQESAGTRTRDLELRAIRPLIRKQQEVSHVPAESELLMEEIATKEGYHLFIYPFEGRFVHEGIASLIAYRTSLLQPITFSIAYNDYGFELLSDQPIPVQAILDNDFFTDDHLSEDLQAAVNANEMARRRFRDIASIAGLVFQGFPGKNIGDRHLQASSQLFFDVFSDHDPHNLLLRESYEEVMDFQMEEARIRTALQRMQSQNVIWTKPKEATPFSFPIMVDRMRERVTSEKLSDRIKKMKISLGD